MMGSKPFQDAALASPAKDLSSDYPQKGFVHKVEKGETVSSIAKKYESKVKWIIDANQIADPTKVFVGKELCSSNNHGKTTIQIGQGIR